MNEYVSDYIINHLYLEHQDVIYFFLLFTFLLYTIIEVIHHTKTHVKGTLILYVQTPQYFVFHWIGEKEGEWEKELVGRSKINFCKKK